MELLLEALNFYHFTQEKYIQWPIVRRHHRLDSQEKGREWFFVTNFRPDFIIDANTNCVEAVGES